MVGLDIKQNGWNMKTSRELQVRQSGLLEIVCVCNRRDCCFSTVPLLISAIMGIVFCVLAFILIIVIVAKH